MDVGGTTHPRTLLRAALLSEMGGRPGGAKLLGDRKASECAHVDFVCAAWFALPSRCAHRAAGLALCLSMRLKNCRPVLLGWQSPSHGTGRLFLILGRRDLSFLIRGLCSQSVLLEALRGTMVGAQ